VGAKQINKEIKKKEVAMACVMLIVSSAHDFAIQTL
jgi:hypothetical protein